MSLMTYRTVAVDAFTAIVFAGDLPIYVETRRANFDRAADLASDFVGEFLPLGEWSPRDDLFCDTFRARVLSEDR